MAGKSDDNDPKSDHVEASVRYEVYTRDNAERIAEAVRQIGRDAADVLIDGERIWRSMTP